MFAGPESFQRGLQDLQRHPDAFHSSGLLTTQRYGSSYIARVELG